MSVKTAYIAGPHDYADLVRDQMVLRDSPSGGHSSAPWSERHLQCVWSDPRLRPATLVTSTGEPLHVESPGRWNLEAGPDFLDTILHVGHDRRRIVGDTEVHVRPGDWHHHGHDSDPRYRRVVLHVTYFPDSDGRIQLPAGMLHLALNTPLRGQGLSALDDIDIMAYPHAALSDTPRPCRLALENASPEMIRDVLSSAGQWRLDQKTARITARIRESGAAGQTLYEELLRALGYKHNRRSSRHLAVRFPLSAWHDGHPEENYAMLLGVAGLLPAPDSCAPPEARAFLRRLWDHWWRNAPDTPCMSLSDWRLSSVRPLNHPRRRLAAAAALFSNGADALLNDIMVISRSDAHDWHRQVSTLLRSRASMPFWTRHTSLTGHPAANLPPALLGPARTAAMVTNVVVPLLASTGHDVTDLARSLPGEQTNSVMRETANRLLGRDHNPALYRSRGLCQQGLMQIYQDFCLNTRDGCRDCTLAERLAEGEGRS